MLLTISIHAPTRGATWTCTPITIARTHFNPRTHEGCDFGGTMISKLCGSFQSTHPRGVRQTLSRMYVLKRKISIHAPTRGATLFGCTCTLYSVFQSTHPRGVRHIINETDRAKTIFQSTHPRGVRLQYGWRHALAKQFQSTHPRGVRRQ